jgi:hypothetical protein
MATARPGALWRNVPENTGNGIQFIDAFGAGAPCGVWESMAIALVETMAESEHHDIDSATVRAQVSAAGAKRVLINELLAARGAGSVVLERTPATSLSGLSLNR